MHRLRCLGHGSLFLDKIVYFGPGDSVLLLSLTGRRFPSRLSWNPESWPVRPVNNGPGSAGRQNAGGGPEERWPQDRLAGDLPSARERQDIPSSEGEAVVFLQRGPVSGDLGPKTEHFSPN